jgi:hypothetical protein
LLKKKKCLFNCCKKNIAFLFTHFSNFHYLILHTYIRTHSTPSYVCTYTQYSFMRMYVHTVLLHTYVRTHSTPSYVCTYTQYSFMRMYVHTVLLHAYVRTHSTPAYVCTYTQYSCIRMYVHTVLLHIFHLYVYVHVYIHTLWNLSKPNTLGTKKVQFREVYGLERFYMYGKYM